MRARAALIWLMLSCAAQADPAVDRGRAIYAGDPGTGLQVQVGQRLRPARGISCAGCHGHDAQGGAEVQSGPAIDWPALEAQGYTPASFARALTQGIAPDGRTLGGAMPRLAFASPHDAAALVAFLTQISAEQRKGITPQAVTFQRPPPEFALAPFWQAFEAQIAALAPQGVFGRQIRLSIDPGFARIGALRPAPADGQPSLFPLHPLIGDEDPATTRGAFASLSAQVQAMAARHPQLAVLAPPTTRMRLADALPDGRIAVIGTDALPVDRPVMMLGADQLAKMPPGADILTTLDDLALTPPAPGRCVQATDPRPADTATDGAMAQYGRVAATALIEALRLCQADCTRAGLMRAFDRVELQPPDWPALDYADHPLTGTDQVRIIKLCDPVPRP
ncbi:c-type cytochrome [Paracoccus sp. R86501]|uniref:c-type cytochrome n=1 Tax=Paracoccus sp. R86501 TaxID=3101711 RepID=UPI00366CE82B